MNSSTSFDVIVLGLGGVGSAVAERLSRAGHKVLGLERFDTVHDKGSSHGESRIIRKAYFEDEKYVPLLLRAYELWNEFEELSNTKLLFKTGCIIIGPEQSSVIQGCLKSARAFSLAHDVLDSSSIASKYGFRVPKEAVGFLEPDGGYLLVEKCRESFIAQAQKNGAELKFHQGATSWRSSGTEVEVVSDGATYKAKKLILCLGPWTGQNLGESIPLAPKRVVQFWFQADRGAELPVFFHDNGHGQWIYGFPKIGTTQKVAFHNRYTDCDPDHVDRSVSKDEIEQMQALAKPLLPTLGEFSHAKTCIYTMTPDEHFILGPLKGANENVFVAGGFSGHGFKFASVIGEIAENFVDGVAKHDLSLFDPYRFKGTS